MLKGSELIGRPIVAFDTGEQIDTIRDLVFDQSMGLLLGFIVDDGGLIRNPRVLPLNSIQSVGPDAVIVPSKGAVIPINKVPDIQRVLKSNHVLRGTKIVTVDGRDFGTLTDLYFDEQSGAIEGYEIRGGAFAGTVAGASFLSADQVIRFGEHVAFVRPGDAAQIEVSAVESEQATPAGEIQQAEDSARDTAPIPVEAEVAEQEEAYATALLPVETETDVQGEGQVLLTANRVVHWDVRASDGTLIARKGEEITQLMIEKASHYDVLDELYWAAGGVLIEERQSRIRPTLEDARGRRVQWTVRASRGLIVAAAGQVVTQRVIDRARLYHKERGLLEAVGLLPREQRTADLDEHFNRAGQRARERLGHLWSRVRSRVEEFRQRNAQQAESQRIKRALGRPATRVILDRQDQIILNVGELITHESIQRAREAGVLDVLLNSVYTREPEFTKEELRAPEAGAAALEESRERSKQRGG